MTSNVNFDAKSVFLELFVIVLYEISLPLNWKIIKMVLPLNLRLKSYIENCFLKNHSCLLLMIGKNVAIRYVSEGTL